MLEHQSTINNNMPIRFLMYVAEEYQRWLALSAVDITESQLSKEEIANLKKQRNVYSSKRIQLPRPEFYVVYTGDTNWEGSELRLSDAFAPAKNGEVNSIELIVKIIKGTDENTTLPEDGVLRGYLFFVRRYKELKDSGKTLEQIVRILQRETSSNELKHFLAKRVEEVINMLSNERAIELAEQALLDEGIEQGKKEMLKRLLGKLPDIEIAEITGVSLEELQKLRAEETENKTSISKATSNLSAF